VEEVEVVVPGGGGGAPSVRSLLFSSQKLHILCTCG